MLSRSLGLVLFAVSSAMACYPFGTTNSPPLTLGTSTKVCLTINGEYRASFDVQVDRMTSMTMFGSYQSPNFITKDKDDAPWSFFEVTAGKARSPQRAYQRPSQGPNQQILIGGQAWGPRVHTVYTAIITVAEGIITGVTWDDGCYGCTYRAPNIGDAGCSDSIMSVNSTSKTYNIMSKDSPNNAYFNGYWDTLCGSGCQTCYSSKAWCDEKCKDKVFCDCDLTIYVVFTGTDASGRYLKSAGLRFSRFQAYSLNSLIDNAKSVTENFLVQNQFA